MVDFGQHGTSESWAKYRATAKQYADNGFVLPEAEPVMERQAEIRVLVRHVTAAYREHVHKRYAQRPRDINRLLNLCDDLDRDFGDLCAVEFGPLRLEQLRDAGVGS